MSVQHLGHPLIELDSVDSTNKYAADRLGLPELQHGTVILAHEQTEGRGQRERTWVSAKDLDLTFSLVLRPRTMKASGQFVLAKVAALAVRDTVAGALLEAHAVGAGPVCVKWPNDVLVGDRKAAGILIQNELAGDRITASVVGVGLNVNSTELHRGLGSTSLRTEVGHVMDRRAVLNDLLARFDRWWTQAQHDRAAVDAAYANVLWGRGRPMALELDGASLVATPLDVDELGRLRLRLPDGSEQAFGLDRLRFAPRFH